MGGLLFIDTRTSLVIPTQHMAIPLEHIGHNVGSAVQKPLLQILQQQLLHSSELWPCPHSTKRLPFQFLLPRFHAAFATNLTFCKQGSRKVC